MNGFARLVLVASALVSVAAADSTVMESVRASRDVAPDTNPKSDFWQGARPVFAETDAMGKPVAGHRSEFRSRWTRDNLYFLFICPYEELNLKPNPKTKAETNELWNWDVAEVFLGSDMKQIRRYKEFEVSPQAEWVDLDINLDLPVHEVGWTWNSGFQVAARIDPTAKVWYGVMRIPYKSVDDKPAAVGNVLRANLYRAQGPAATRKGIAWQPTMRHNYHTPEKFGTLKLVD
jgi:hypothetical protein